MNVNTIMALSNYNGFVRMSNGLNYTGMYNGVNSGNATNNQNSIYDILSTNSSYNLNNVNKFKSQLVDIQNKYKENIEKLDKYTKESNKFYTDFTEKFSDLKTSANKLKTYSSNSVFKSSGYESTNSDVVSVKDSSKYSGKDVAIEVENIATAQTTVTNKFDSAGMDLMRTGTLSISSGDKTYNLDLNLLNASNNKEAIKKISEQVNNSDIGIKAQVIESEGKSQLAFTSATTGENARFTAKFEGRLENSVTLSNSKEAQNAKYKVNGTLYTSQSNNIKLEDKMEITLKGAGKADISDGILDSSKIVDAVKNFANDYNEVVSFLKDNSSKSYKIENLAYSFNTNKFLNNSLSGIGMEIDSTGKINVNEKELKSSIENDINNVKKVLGNSSGIANSAYDKATEAMKNGKNLYPQFEGINNDISTYSYTNSNIIFSQYNSVYNNGLFLNYLL